MKKSQQFAPKNGKRRLVPNSESTILPIPGKLSINKLYKELKVKYGNFPSQSENSKTGQNVEPHFMNATQPKTSYTPEEWTRHKNMPTPVNRPKFHVAAKNYPIPELRLSGLSSALPSRSDSPPEKDEAKTTRSLLADAFHNLRKDTRKVYKINCNIVTELGVLSNQLSDEVTRLEGWKRKYAHLQKRQHELRKAKSEDVEISMRDLRQEIRALRQELGDLEAHLEKCMEQRRSLRTREEGLDGPYVTELRAHNGLKEKLDKEIGKCVEERKELEESIQIIWDGLTNQISGLIQTNGDVNVPDYLDQLSYSGSSAFDNQDSMGTGVSPSPNSHSNYGNYSGDRSTTVTFTNLFSKETTPASRDAYFIEKAKIRSIQTQDKIEALATTKELRRLLLLDPITPETKEVEVMEPEAEKIEGDDVNEIEKQIEQDENKDQPVDYVLAPRIYYSHKRRPGTYAGP